MDEQVEGRRREAEAVDLRLECKEIRRWCTDRLLGGLDDRAHDLLKRDKAVLDGILALLLHDALSSGLSSADERHDNGAAGIEGVLCALGAEIDAEGNQEGLEELQVRTPQTRAAAHANEHIGDHGELEPPAAERLVEFLMLRTQRSDGRAEGCALKAETARHVEALGSKLR